MWRRLIFSSAIGVLVLVAALTAVGSHLPTVRTQFGQFAVIESVNAASDLHNATPAIPETAARAAALTEAASVWPDLRGLNIASAAYAPGVLQATAAQGSIHFTQDTPANLWLIELSGPPQAGYAHTTGLVVIDATTGHVIASGVGQYN